MKKVIFVVFLTAAAVLARAEKWQIIGPRAMGMGGAGVAAAYGADAQYWNPALLARDDDAARAVNAALNAGINTETTKNALDSLSTLSDIADRFSGIQQKIQSGGSATAQETADIFNGLSALENLASGGTGALFQADAGFGLRLKKLSFSLRSYGSVGVTPKVDTLNIGLGLNPGAAGLNLSNTAAPADPTLAQASNALQNSINGNNLTASLGNLLGMPGASSADISNAIVNMASAGGSTPQQVLDMANQVGGGLGGLAGIINGYGAGTGSYKNNTSQANADGGLFTEFSAGYGFKLMPGLSVGGNLKLIQGAMAQAGVMVLSDASDVSRTVSDAFDNDKTSYNFGVDAGALFNFGDFLGKKIPWNPQVGLTARNINNPGFARPSKPAGSDPALDWKTGDYHLGPQLRLGAAAEPLRRLTLAADLDLTKNKTLVDGFDSRQLAAGAEFNVINGRSFKLPLRAGLNKNLAADGSIMYTAGAGFYAARFNFDLTAGMSGSTTDINGAKIPSSAAAALGFGLVF